MGRLLLESKASPLVRSYTKWESRALRVGRDGPRETDERTGIFPDARIFEKGMTPLQAVLTSFLGQKQSQKTTSWEFRRVIAVCSKKSDSLECLFARRY